MRFAYRTDTASLGASTNGTPFKVERMDECNFQFVWTDAGSLSGTVKLQVSNDAFTGNIDELNPNSHWEDYSASPYAVSGSSSHNINVADMGFTAIRWVWTRTAGTGSLTVNITGKGPT